MPRDRTDTIGWLGELLVRAILKRNELAYITHNSMPDADDPTIGISLNGKEIHIPLPDFKVSVAGGTLFTRQLESKAYHVEVKTKSYFGFFNQWDAVTTGFDNVALELYHRLNEEHGWDVKVWFVQIFNRCEAQEQAYTHHDAVAGIYEADINQLYASRPLHRFNDLSCWPVRGGPLQLLNLRSELETAEDTRDLVSELLKVALRDATIPPNPATRIETRKRK